MMESLKSWFRTNKYPFLLFFAISAVWFIWIGSQPDMNFMRGDALLVSVDGAEFMVDSVKNRHELPYWNPYLLGGMPYQATMNATVTLHPLYFIYHLIGLTQPLVGQIEFCLSLFIAGFFMFLFLSELGLSRMASLIGGVFFMHCGDIITLSNAGHIYNIESIALIPAVFFFYERGFKSGKLFPFVLAGCMLGVQSLLCVYQLLVFTVICMTLYLAYKIILERAKKIFILYFVLAVLVAPLISAMQILQSFYYVGHSFRSGVTYEFFTSWSFHPTELIIYIYPRFFGLIPPTYWGHSPFWQSTTAFGIVPLLLAFTAMFFRIKEKPVLFFGLLSGFIMIMAFGGFTPLYKLLYHIPVINGFRNSSRWLGFFAFAMITLSAYGVDMLAGLAAKNKKALDFKGYKTYFIVLGALAALSFLVFLGFSSDPNGTMLSMQKWEGIKSRFAGPNLDNYISAIFRMISEDMIKFSIIFSLAAGTVLLAFMGKINKVLFAGLLVIVFAVDMLLFWSQFKLVEKISEDPIKAEILTVLEKQKNTGPFRVFPMGQLSMGNWYMSEKIQSIQGYHSAPLKNYYKMMQAGVLSKLNYLGLMNVKYLLSMEKIKHPLLKPINEGNVNIYESGIVFPRSFLVGEVLVLKDSEEISKKFDDPKYNPVKMLILEEDIKERIEPIKINGSEVKIDLYTPNKVVLTANAPGDCMLFLGDIYYPEWEAFVDGKRTKIYQAYGALRAIYMPKGEHKVEFVFSKQIFHIGLLISLLTLTGIITVFGFLRPKI